MLAPDLAAVWLPTRKNPPVNPPGANFGLWAQERAATRFFERNAEPVLTALNKLGYKAELIKVQG